MPEGPQPLPPKALHQDRPFGPPRLSTLFHFLALKDKLALAPGQSHVKLAQGERQCSQCTSSQKVTSRYTFNSAISSVPWCTPVTCAPATASRPAASWPPCSACTEPR